MNIGIDIGGTNIGAGLVDEDLNVVYRLEIPTERDKGYDYIEKKIIEIIEKMIHKSSRINETIDSIGIGIPGIGDLTGDYIIYCTNLNWKDVPLGRNLRSKFDIKINIENDATVAGIAESALGVMKGYPNSVFITLGTGVGGGIILNNNVYTGSHGVGSELGHMIVGENFYDCNCGNNGCLETFASSTAIERYVINEIENGFRDTSLLDNLENIDTKLIFQSAKLGDDLSNRAVDRLVKYLTIGISNIINTIDPDVIAIGGGVARAGDFLLDKINNLLPKYILMKDLNFAKIKLARLGNDAGIIGAAMLNRYKCDKRTVPVWQDEEILY